MAITIIAVAILISPCVGILLHGTAFFLLWKKDASISMNQKIILMNLSLVEICIRCCGLARRVIAITIGFNNPVHSTFAVLFYSFLLSYLFTMATLTLDRFLQVYLNIKYDLYWSVRTTKIVLGIIWSITFLIGNSLTLLVNLQKDTYTEVLWVTQVLVNPLLSLIFLLVVMSVYAYIALKIIQTRRGQAKVTFTANELQSSRDCKRTKLPAGIRLNEILMPTILILTYILFIVIPVFIVYLEKRNILTEKVWFRQVLPFLFYVGCSSDAIICILLSTKIGRWIISRSSRKRQADISLQTARISTA